MQKTLTFKWDDDDETFTNYEMENILYGGKFRLALGRLTEFLRNRCKYGDDTPPKDWYDVRDQIWSDVLDDLPILTEDL